MAAPVRLVKKQEVKVAPTHSSSTLFCPLFEHQKHTDVCTVLRAKRICRVDCAQYFEFARKNEESVRAVLQKYRPNILSALKTKDKTTDDLLKNVMPQGEFICEYCAKAFKAEGRLNGHIKRKHRRETRLPRSNVRNR